MAKITESRPPMMGQQHSYSLTPPANPGCRVTFLINGQTVTIRDEVGGLRVVGFGAAGTMTVEVIGNTTGTTVEARIDCPEVSTILAGPIVVGSGSYDSCEQDPCKTRRQSYIEGAVIAIQSERRVKPICSLYRFFVRATFVVFLLFVALVGAAVACRALFWVPVVCVAIDTALVTLAAGLAAATAKLLLLRRQLYHLQIACGLDAAVMAGRYLQMQLDCPRDCWIPEVKVNCDCR